MLHRLATIAPDLYQSIQDASIEMRRRIAFLSAKSGVAATALSDPSLEAALKVLASGQIASDEEVTRVKDVAQSLDEEYFNAHEKFRRGIVDEGTYLKLFYKARAASAVAFALDPAALTAALESLYEANAAGVDLATLRAEVRKLSIHRHSLE